MGVFSNKWVVGGIVVGVIVVAAVISMNKIGHKSAPTNNVAATSQAPVIAPAAPTSSSTSAAASAAPANQNQTTSPAQSPTVNSAPVAASPSVAGKPSAQQHLSGAQTAATGHAVSPSPSTSVAQTPAQGSVPGNIQNTAPVPPEAVNAPAQPARVSPENVAQPVAQATTAPANGPPAMMRTSGSVDLNGTRTLDSAPVYLNDKIDTPSGNNAVITSPGNTILLAPQSHFVAGTNEYILDDGASKVSTSTGMVTKLNCFSVVPVNPAIPARYEVTYEGKSAYIYARQGDVYIKEATRTWRVVEGKVAKISNVPECKPEVLYLNNPAAYPKYVMAGAGVAAGIVVWRLSMSPSSPAGP